MKGIGPKASIKVGANQHGAKGVPNGLMSSFHGAILMGAIGTSRTNGIAMALEKSADFLVVVQFSTLVEVDILARDVWSMLF